MLNARDMAGKMREIPLRPWGRAAGRKRCPGSKVWQVIKLQYVQKGRKYDLWLREQTINIITFRLIPDAGLQNKKGFTITVINMLRDLVEKVGNKCEEMEDFSTEMETTEKGQMEMVDVKKKNTVVQMKNQSVGFTTGWI